MKITRKRRENHKIMQNITIAELNGYLESKRTKLGNINHRLEAVPVIYHLFCDRKWSEKVEEQLTIWQKSDEISITKRIITIPEYELFRYFEEDYFLEKFITYFCLIETIISSDRTKYRKWNETKVRFFAQQVSQIYSAIFELFILGELISLSLDVDPYYENIDGRTKIDDRYIYFEIKSLQRTRFDLDGVGTGGIQHDEHQIMTALKEKAQQLSPYSNEQCVIFLSLYLSADMVTSSWSIEDFFNTEEGRRICAVVVSSWFTAGAGKIVIANPAAEHPLSPGEISKLAEHIDIKQ